MLSEFEMLLSSSTRPSEVDHVMMSMTEAGIWIGVDTYLFLLTRTGLLAAYPDFVTDEFYEMVVTLSNMMYYMNYGRVTEGIINMVESLGNKFGEQWLEVMGEALAWWKFHILCCHFYQLMRAFGEAQHFDAFVSEFMLGQMVRMSTSRVNLAVQVAFNTLMRFHSTFDRFLPYFGESTKMWLKGMGVQQSGSPQLSIFAIKRSTGEQAKVPENELQVLNSMSAFSGLQDELSQDNVKRVTKVRFGAMCLTSSRYQHIGKVNDSFVQVEGEFFGRIQEMYEVQHGELPETVFIIKVHAYNVVGPLFHSDAGDVIKFPVNQQPREPSDPPCFAHFSLAPSLFIQKVVISDFLYTRPALNVMRALTLYSVLPHQYSFR